MERQYGVANCFRIVINQGGVSDIYQRIMMFTLFSHCLGIRVSAMALRKTCLHQIGEKLNFFGLASRLFVERAGNTYLCCCYKSAREGGSCISSKMFISNTKTHDFGQSWVFLSLFYWIYRSPTRSFEMTLVGILNSVTPIYPGATSYSSNDMTSL